MRIATALLAAWLAAGSAAAQPSQPSAAPLDEIAAKLARDAEIAEQDRRSEALNVELNRRNAEIAARNDAAQKAYDAALADYARAKAAYEAGLAQHEAQAAEYRRAYGHWQAQVAACKAGDFRRCAPKAVSGPGSP
ncbi:hypothetical protein [Phenylobacterium sp.]|uniref:hypothetical protein n=1 Tax=Phenylobacterium sp. TaxID=1871053 RepID=UPI0035B41E4E